MSNLAGQVGDSFYRNLFENAGIAFVGSDRELNIQALNGVAEDLFGKTAEEMVGRPLSSLVPQDLREAIERKIRQAMDEGEVSDFEFQYDDGDSNSRKLLLTFSPIADDAGERIGVSAGARDITRRARLQTQLLESRKMTSLGHMAGAMAHHFNNILGGIITSVDYANASDNAAIKGRILKLISDGLSRATTLLKGLLSFAEGETCSSDLSDFTEILNSVADLHDARLESEKIELEMDLSDMPVVAVPRTQVSTVIRNIFENAVDATSSGGKITVTADVNDDWVVARVADDGCGIEPDALTRVFEPFYSTKDVLDGGTEQARGLGLAIAHGIVQVLGGSITVCSQLGKGATFVVSIPRKDWQPDGFVSECDDQGPSTQH